MDTLEVVNLPMRAPYFYPTSQSNLAMVLQELGDLEGAKTLLIDSYEAFKNLLGEDHPNTLTVKGNLEFVEFEIQKR